MGNGLRPYEHRPLSSEWRHFVHRDIGTRIILGEIVDALRASDLGTRILRIITDATD